MKYEQVGKLFRALMAPVRAMHQQCERCAAGPGRATEILPWRWRRAPSWLTTCGYGWGIAR